MPISSTQAPRLRVLLRHVGHIDGDEIHGHAAEERRGVRTEIDLQSLLAVGDRERAEEAVGIANGKGGDARGTLQRSRRSVSHGLAGRNVAHLQDAPGKLDHRRKAIGAGSARLAAIKRDTGTDEVDNDRLVPSRMPAELARLAGAFGNFARRASKAFAAVSFFGCVRFVGAGKVAHHQCELEGAQQALCACEGIDLVGRKSEPVHAAVDMDGGRELRAARPNRTPPILRSQSALLSTGRKPKAR